MASCHLTLKKKKNINVINCQDACLIVNLSQMRLYICHHIKEKAIQLSWPYHFSSMCVLFLKFGINDFSEVYSLASVIFFVSGLLRFIFFFRPQVCLDSLLAFKHAYINLLLLLGLWQLSIGFNKSWFFFLCNFTSVTIGTGL